MKNDEAVKEGVVGLEGCGDLGPARRGDGGAVEQGGEFKERVANVSGVGGGWCAEGGEEGFGMGGSEDWEGVWRE